MIHVTLIVWRVDFEGQS